MKTIVIFIYTQPHKYTFCSQIILGIDINSIVFSQALDFVFIFVTSFNNC